MFQTGEWCAENKHVTSLLPPDNNDSRSDSIDLTHAWITLDMSNSASQLISGNCRWAFTPKLENVQQLRFDLLALQVDSVVLNNIKTSFSRVGEQIIIPLADPLTVNSINQVTIYYQGKPQGDASGWGGFYFSGNYAFNLGVGFAADPHVFGRAWFPCFDNFTERSTYSFDIYTTPTQPAYCNGYLLADEMQSNGKRRRVWSLNQTIPSYLACVAIGPYTSFQRTYPGVNNPIPMDIAAAPADTVKVRNTFIHMPEAIEAFEYWYGPYKWPKIGFSLVPFNSGAMEHATNVAIGRSFIDGTLSSETLWAHELSHHWWGDLATCSTAEDMWLNEGWASYSEHIFTERVYGVPAYRNAVRTNFLNVLQNAHVAEGGYLAVSGVPHSLTYGSHVYNKGAVVAHNLRGYMGDSLFRQGIRSALEATSFKDWSSAGFRDLLFESTGLDLTSFFQNWVFSGGYSDFLIDSSHVNNLGGGQYEVSLYVKQKLRGAPAFFTDVPLEFTFLNANHERFHRTAMVSGENSLMHFTLDFNPEHTFVNTRIRITQARSDVEKSIVTTGTTNLPDAKMSILVHAVGADSVLLRAEHHFAAPDNAGANPGNYHLTNRFWEVSGDFPAGFDVQATFVYDGRPQADLLDAQLFAATGPSEDSIVLLYRPGAGHPWQEWSDYVKLVVNSTTDKFGQLRLQHLRAGQYTIAKGVSSVGSHEPSFSLGEIRVSPNPASDQVLIKSGKNFDHLQVIGADGSVMEDLSFEKTKSRQLSLRAFPAGHYWLVLSGREGMSTAPIIKL